MGIGGKAPDHSARVAPINTIGISEHEPDDGFAIDDVLKLGIHRTTFP